MTEFGKPIEAVDQSVPLQSIDTAKVACVILAGGMGSRLGIDGPKGCVRLPSYQNQMLFEILRDKTDSVPVAVMTSSLNHEETKQATRGYGWEYFQQSTLPFLDDKGNWIGHPPYTGPDGNGKVFAYLKQSGILEKWKKCGIEYLSIIPIDNPKADPLNPRLLSQIQKGCDLVVTAIERGGPKDRTGVLVEKNGLLGVAEYSEASAPGPYAYSGLFALTVDLAEYFSSIELPWHVARKEFQGQPIWKFEYFIFDLFQYAKSYKIIYQSRKECFAPIKDKEDLL
ncbi:MAG: UTP--glucose-1-phosphate uridylyltransferase [Chlamydiales bacterium]|nr:UTP--glucose-1-phosphate uridylyltransferase [Chlamydiales bacterium]